MDLLSADSILSLRCLQCQNLRELDLSNVRHHVIGELNPVQRALAAVFQAPHNLRSPTRKRGRSPGEWCSVGRWVTSQKQLRQLSSLQHIKVSGMHFGRSGIRNISQLSQLKHVDLSGSNIPNIGMEELRRLRHLESLNLENCDSVQPHTMLVSTLRTSGLPPSLRVSLKCALSRGPTHPLSP